VGIRNLYELTTTIVNHVPDQDWHYDCKKIEVDNVSFKQYKSKCLELAYKNSHNLNQQEKCCHPLYDDQSNSIPKNFQK